MKGLDIQDLEKSLIGMPEAFNDIEHLLACRFARIDIDGLLVRQEPVDILLLFLLVFKLESLFLSIVLCNELPVVGIAFDSGLIGRNDSVDRTVDLSADLI